MTQKDKVKQQEDKKEEEEEKKEEGPDIHQDTDDIREANQIVQNFAKATVEVQGLKMYNNIGTLYMQAMQL